MNRRSTVLPGSLLSTGVSAPAGGTSRRNRGLSSVVAALVVVATVPTFLVDGILHGPPVNPADPTAEVATLAGVVLFAVLAAATPRPLSLWLRAIAARPQQAPQPVEHGPDPTHREGA